MFHTQRRSGGLATHADQKNQTIQNRNIENRNFRKPDILKVTQYQDRKLIDTFRITRASANQAFFFKKNTKSPIKKIIYDSNLKLSKLLIIVIVVASATTSVLAASHPKY